MKASLLARWNHYAYVYEGPKKTATLYINGVKNTTIKGQVLATSAEAITIGAARDATSVLGKHMQGYINSMRIHGGVLTPANILANFKVGPTRNPVAAPIVSTTGVSGLSPTTATLNGLAVANGAPTTAWIEWGTALQYDNATAPIAVAESLAQSHRCD